MIPKPGGSIHTICLRDIQKARCQTLCSSYDYRISSYSFFFFFGGASKTTIQSIISCQLLVCFSTLHLNIISWSITSVASAHVHSWIMWTLSMLRASMCCAPCMRPLTGWATAPRTPFRKPSPKPRQPGPNFSPKRLHPQTEWESGMINLVPPLHMPVNNIKTKPTSLLL